MLECTLAPQPRQYPTVQETSYSHSRPKWRFDGMEVRINDAPRANEIMVAIAVTDSRRPLARAGGLTKDKIKGEEGLRTRTTKGVKRNSCEAKSPVAWRKAAVS